MIEDSCSGRGPSTVAFVGAQRTLDCNEGSKLRTAPHFPQAVALVLGLTSGLARCFFGTVTSQHSVKSPGSQAIRAVAWACACDQVQWVACGQRVLLALQGCCPNAGSDFGETGEFKSDDRSCAGRGPGGNCDRSQHRHRQVSSAVTCAVALRKRGLWSMMLSMHASAPLFWA